MPTPGESLAVILGASGWPLHPSFETSPSFQNSANFFRDYLLREDGLGLAPANVLWLFDIEDQPGAIIGRIKEFFRKNVKESVRDVVFFYVWHGGYLNRDYFLALRCTERDNLDLTVLPVKYIAKAFYEETPDKRHIVIIDACYASGAVKDFISQEASVAVADVKQQIDDGCARRILIGVRRCSARPVRKPRLEHPGKASTRCFRGLSNACSARAILRSRSFCRLRK
jgi:hypothetical protein